MSTQDPPAPSFSSVHRTLFTTSAASERSSTGSSFDPNSQTAPRNSEDKADVTDLDFTKRAASAAGAAVLSAIIVNPLDVVKTRLQAQAAGAVYQHATRHISSLSAEAVVIFIPHLSPMLEKCWQCPPVCPRGGVSGVALLCPPTCYRYNGTFDVFYKIIRQEGIHRLWRGTNAGLVLAVPTVGIYLPCYDVFRDSLERYSRDNWPQLASYAPLIAGSLARSLACIICSPIELAKVRMQAQREVRAGVKPPGMGKTLLGVLSTVTSTSGGPLQGVRVLWTGVGAQLARDVPFSAICWATLEPLRREFLQWLSLETSAASILGANFSAGFIAGCIAAAATCPLDVAKTRRQIEKDPVKVLRASTRQILMQIWRKEGLQGLFMGVIPRVGRAGPSVGIVVSFYELVKYALHQSQVHG